MTNRLNETLEALRRTPNRWLVTGGAGFIGSHLVQALLREGQRVRVLDNFTTGALDNLEAVRRHLPDDSWERLELVIGDIRDHRRCELAVRNIDFVLHQAAFVSVPASIEHPDEAHSVNVTGTVNLLLACRVAKVQRVVLASSAAVYGDQQDLPLRENVPAEPLSPYAASKAATEAYVSAFHRAYGLPAIALRYFNVVGPRQSTAYAAVVPTWLRAMADGRAPTIFGDGRTTRDFCAVDNVVRANLLAAHAPADALGRAYNIASGKQTQLLELAEMLRDRLRRLGVARGALQPTFEPPRPGDIRRSHADITLAREALGYSPEVTLDEALAKMIDEYFPTPQSEAATVSELPRVEFSS